MKDKILNILPLVTKPSRYIGAEVNSCIKDPAKVSLRVALCFPDTYEVGISHLGLKILYDILNARDDIYAERAYAPWADMEARLREARLPLTTVETFAPLSGMDIVGFTLQYELSYTNVLNMLDLAGIPLRAAERDGGHPLVIAGGPCAFNPEPLADFIDAFVIGDGEESVLEVADAVIASKKTGRGREALLLALSKIDGVYVPAHFEVRKGEGGRITGVKNIAGGPDRVRKSMVSDLDSAAFPKRPLLPYMAAVHNRITLEISRGCSRGCRFCQAGFIYRPVRERTPETLRGLAKDSVCATGYEELSLSSLSAGDYSALLPLMKSLMDRYADERVSISLPSLRVGTLTPEMCREIKRVRKTGFTIAPEAGTQRLRDVINKNITGEALAETAETVFREGWELIKLYFMVGLPTETDEDMEGIISLSRTVLDAGKKAGGRRKGVNVGVSVFVPKPHTPFQWMGQIPMGEMRRKKDFLKRVLGKKPFAMKSGFVEMSVLEAAFARGGREVGQALENAWRLGARFDGWTEEFNFGRWLDAFKEAGLDLHKEAEREYGLEEVLPWDHIDSGIKKAYLKKELEKALETETTEDCRRKCTGCGLKCDLDKKDNVAAAGPAEPAPAPAPKRPAVPGARVRLKYSKLAPLSMLSHTEMMTLFFRAAARANIPVAFSEGFNPHPKMSFGPALGVGIESEAEVLDIELSYAIDLLELVKGLNRELPAGIRILETRALAANEPAAGSGAKGFVYEAVIPDGRLADAEVLAGAFLKRSSATISRTSDKGTKELDIRPMVDTLDIVDGGRIRFALVEADGKSAKPFELMQAVFGLGPAEAKTTKIKRLLII